MCIRQEFGRFHKILSKILDNTFKYFYLNIFLKKQSFNSEKVKINDNPTVWSESVSKSTGLNKGSDITHQYHTGLIKTCSVDIQMDLKAQ